MPQSLSLTLLLIAALLFTSGCAKSPIPAHYYVFVDRSASITPNQRAHWKRAADTLFSRMAGGDRISIFPIHANTGAAAAAYDGQSDRAEDGAPYDVTIRCAESFDKMLAAARLEMDRLLSDPERSPETDIFSIADRIDPSSENYRTEVVILSDMLHSRLNEFDMETQPMPPGSFGSIIQAAATRHHWGPRRLAGVAVRCVLPTVDARPRHEVNDRLTLKEFWTALFSALGADLKRCETNL